MNQLSVVSWNVNRFEKYDEIVRSFQEMQPRPQIIFLEEAVDRYEKVLGGSNTANMLNNSLGNGYNVVWAPSLLKEQWNNGKGDYDLGNAVLVDRSLPISDIRSYFLSNLEEYDGRPETEPRIAIAVELDIEEPILILGTHTAYSENEDKRKFTPSVVRRKQFKRMVDISSPFQRVIIIGDLNSPPNSNDLGILTQNGFRNADTVTPDESTWFPAHMVSAGIESAGIQVENERPWRLDHSFVKGFQEVDFQILRNVKGSDHVPIMCTVK